MLEDKHSTIVWTSFVIPFAIVIAITIMTSVTTVEWTKWWYIFFIILAVGEIIAVTAYDDTFKNAQEIIHELQNKVNDIPYLKKCTMWAEVERDSLKIEKKFLTQILEEQNCSYIDKVNQLKTDTKQYTASLTTMEHI